VLEALLQKDDTVERCGLILTDGKPLELTNIAEEPDKGFEMDPEQVLGHIDDAIGTWHTHPFTTPILSGEDYLFFLSWPDLDHNIIGYDLKGMVQVLSYKVEDGVVVQCE
jgi:proteasome lid subunit RPN8/RPN11